MKIGVEVGEREREWRQQIDVNEEYEQRNVEEEAGSGGERERTTDKFITETGNTPSKAVSPNEAKFNEIVLAMVLTLD